MLPTVLGCCDEDLQSKFRNRANFDYLKSYGNTLGLLNAIDQEGYTIRIAEYAPVTYHQAQVKFYRLIQGRDGHGHTLSNYLEHHFYMVDLT